MKASINRLSSLGTTLLRACFVYALLPGLALAQGICQGLSTSDCRALAGRQVFALTSNNVIAEMYGSKPLFSYRVTGIDGNLIGIDFRPSQYNFVCCNSPRTPGMYGITDTGKIYSISIGNPGAPGSAVVAPLGTAFDAGVQSLADFNPVLDALRLIGTNDQNFAVVNSSGNLNVTAPQTAITYAAGDPQAGVDPSLTGGAYNNNVVGATATIFYGLDHARDTMVTIADLTASGSSNTGGGKLKTIGRIVDPTGKPINIHPTADIDIYTDNRIGNAAVIANGTQLYYVNLATVNTNLPIGTTQDVVVTPLAADPPFPLGITTFSPSPYEGGFVDVAVGPTAQNQNPADVSLTVTATAQGRDAQYFGWTKPQQLTYTVQATNLGPDPTTQLTVYSDLFPFTDPVSISTSIGTCSVANYALPEYGKTISCNVGILASGATANITIIVTKPASQYLHASEINTSFAAGSRDITIASNDPNYSNDQVSKKVVVSNP